MREWVMKRLKTLRIMLLALVMIAALPGITAEAATLTGTFKSAAGTVQVTGKWKKNKKKNKYYFKTSSGKLKMGWLTLPAGTYYLRKNGFRANGQVKIGGKYYYFRKNGKQRTGTITVKGTTYYFDPANGGARTDIKTEKDGKLRNAFGADGTYYDAKGFPIRRATLKKLLQTALKPVGQTMYVWGGGWNQVDTGSGLESTTIGVSPQWKKFFNKQTSSYDYRTTRYQVHNGLDCSGFVAWVIYNTFNTESGHGGYVMLAQKMAKTFAGWGWGKYKSPRAFTDWRAGDIMSLPAGHVYIVIGKCNDGSVVLVHSSPKGVMINGTVSRSGKVKSKAWKLARKYMKKYYPVWYKRYPDVSRGSSYLNNYGRMRWNLGTKNSVMSDPEGLRKMSAKKVLKVIFNEK